jgi:hypothetical protein
MAELKTKQTTVSVPAFIKSLADEQTRRDCKELAATMKAITGSPPKMWGASIVGFGKCHLKYASGRELDWFYVGFAPRKQNLSLYLSCDLSKHAKLLKNLGKYKAGKGCLYIKTLDEIDRDVLKELIWASMHDMEDFRAEAKQAR